MSQNKKCGSTTAHEGEHDAHDLKGFGERLRQLRGDDSQDHFAREMGVSRGTLGRYERGETAPDYEFLRGLLAAYHVDATWLLTGVGGSPRPDSELLTTVYNNTGYDLELLAKCFPLEGGKSGKSGLDFLADEREASGRDVAELHDLYSNIKGGIRMLYEAALKVPAEDLIYTVQGVDPALTKIVVNSVEQISYELGLPLDSEKKGQVIALVYNRLKESGDESLERCKQVAHEYLSLMV